MKDNSNTENAPRNRIEQLETAAELDAFISKSTIALVEFYTDGCGICQSMEPVVSNLARAVDIPVGTVNPRDDPPLIERFEVRSVPLFVLFVEGSPVGRLADGFVSGDELTDWVETNSETTSTESC